MTEMYTGRNLVINASQYTENTPFSFTSSRQDGVTNMPPSVYMECIRGETYTLQCKTDGKWGKHITNGTGGGQTHIYLYLQTEDKVGGMSYDYPLPLISDGYPEKTGLGIWTFTVPEDKEYVRIIFRFDIHSDGTTNHTVNWWDLKVEHGSEATAYRPAPEDILSGGGLIL